MTQFEWIVAAAVIVAAAAIVLQTVLLTAMWLASRNLTQQITSLIARVEPMTDTGHKLLHEAREQFGEISRKTGDILDISKRQLGRVDEVLADAAARSKTQMDRIEMVLDDTINRFQETTSLLQTGVLRPVRQLAGISAGIRAAFSILSAGRRTSVDSATHDEEMFI